MQKSMGKFLAVMAQQVHEVPAEDGQGDRIPVDDQVDCVSEDARINQVPAEDDQGNLDSVSEDHQIDQAPVDVQG